MALSVVTDKVLQQVHELTGRPVVVDADPTLKLIASSKIARGNAPVHLVSYNPSASANADYLIVFQCGFILRMFSLPVADRFDFQPSWRGRKDVEKLVTDHLRVGNQSVPKEMRPAISNQLLDGLTRQLRSVPVGLRIDAWIIKDHPDLIDQQKAIIGRQLLENMSNLGPQVRKFAPAKIVDANFAMNTAFALFWSRAWSDLTQLSPYKAAGTLSRGERLLCALDEVAAGPENDRALIDRWGNNLGLGGWYEFAKAAG